MQALISEEHPDKTEHDVGGARKLRSVFKSPRTAARDFLGCGTHGGGAMGDSLLSRGGQRLTEARDKRIWRTAAARWFRFIAFRRAIATSLTPPGVSNPNEMQAIATVREGVEA